MNKKSVIKDRNTFCFGIGTLGRDMVYTMVSMYLLFYLTDVLELPNSTIWAVTIIMLFARIFDAVNDPVMGIIVDNTHTKYGKFKPWLIIGAIISTVIVILLFSDLGLRGNAFVIVFTIIYLGWDVGWTANDIPYWSMLPSLSTSQSEREKIGSFARICANIGMFFVVAGLVPITNALASAFGGDMKKAYFVFVIGIVVVFLLGTMITVVGTKEKLEVKEEHTKLSELFKVIFQNDQLLYVAISMSLFMIGYSTTTSFGLYFFKYAYGNEGMYSIFAIVLAVSQITALTVFPQFTKKMPRKKLYAISTVLVLLGYAVFFFSPMNMLPIGIAGVLIFIGQAFIQILMLMFLADTVEYGQWKLGRRNNSITFSLQPFINKMGGAVANAIVGAVVVMSGINDATSAADVSADGIFMMKIAMLVFPLICIVVGYLIYAKKFIIDEKMYSKILVDLEERGDIHTKD